MSMKSASLASVTANTETQLVQVTSGKTLSISDFTICNYSGSSAAVEVKLNTSADALRAYLVPPGTNLALGGILSMKGMVGQSLDKFTVKSSQANVSFLLSGMEV